MREYAMHCIDCGEFTTLGAFVENEGHFEGEYSLLHNRRANSDELLCRFLIRHARHTLRMEASRTKSYSEAIRTGARFMDGEIDAIVEQQTERERDRENERAMERNLGQLELNVLRGLLAGEARPTARRRRNFFSARKKA